MDELLKFGALLKKYHFWILVVLIVSLSASLWAKAAADLTNRAEARRKELEATRKSLKDITEQPNPSNLDVVKAVKDADEKLKGDVERAWEFLYKEQKAKNPWPKDLGDAFIKYMNSLDLDGEKTPEIEVNQRRTYGWYVRDFIIPTLDSIIDRRRPKGASETGDAGTAIPAVGGRPEAATEKVGKVIWDGIGQLRQDYVWRNEVPSSLHLRLAQEDFWVYQALLRIVAATNEGATDYSNAVVKVIDNLDIGRKASGSFGSQTAKPPTSADGPKMSAEELALLSGRYLDQERQPLAAGEPAPFPQFNMMPVRMTVIMDQKKIPNLLAACGNCSMPVEVQRVTITSLQAPPRAAGSPGAPPVAMNAAPAGPLGFGQGNLAGPAVASTEVKDVGDNYVRVEVLGVIYIFKSPDKTRLESAPAGAPPAGGLGGML